MLPEAAAVTRFGVEPAGVTLALHRLGCALRGTAMAAAGRKTGEEGKAGRLGRPREAFGGWPTCPLMGKTARCLPTNRRIILPIRRLIAWGCDNSRPQGLQNCHGGHGQARIVEADVTGRNHRV